MIPHAGGGSTISLWRFALAKARNAGAIELRCHNCGNRIRLDDAKAGYEFECPKCGVSFVVPHRAASWLESNRQHMTTITPVLPATAETSTNPSAPNATAEPEVPKNLFP